MWYIGILSFLRFVGCCYFRKHKAVFIPAYPTPMTVFNSLAEPHLSPEAHHSAWLGVMRQKIWNRIKYEEEICTQLERHWQRSCWVLSVWKQANSNNIVYPPLDSSGWKVSNTDKLQIDWDSDQNVAEVQARVHGTHQKSLWMQNRMHDHMLQMQGCSPLRSRLLLS